MHDCTHCGGRYPTAIYVEHVKHCIQEILNHRTAAEASARYFASIYRQSRFQRKAPALLIERYQ